MPQMAPMNWTLLFSMVILLFITTKTLIYFTFTPNIPSSSSASKLNYQLTKLNWKW